MDLEKQVEARVKELLLKSFECPLPAKAPIALVPQKQYPVTMGPGRPRGSGFPYCPVKHVYKDLVPEKFTLATTFYLDVGTAVHAAFQRYVAHTGKCWGDYGCPVCGFSSIRKSPWCPKCKKKGNKVECEYREIEYKYGPIIPHLDGMFDLDDLGEWIIDYKTTSVRNVGSDMLPYIKNQHQLSSYVAIVHRERPTVKGYCLIYVPRDDPKRLRVIAIPMDKKKRAKALARVDSYVEQCKLPDKYTTTKNPHNDATAQKLLRKIVKGRPCTSYEVNEKLDHESCPLFTTCLSPKRTFEQSTERIIKVARSWTDPSIEID